MTVQADSVELDAYPLPVLVADRDGVVVASNVASGEAFGGSLVGLGLEALFPDEGGVQEVLEDLARNRGRRSRVHAQRLNGVPFTANALANFTAEGELLFTLRPLPADDLVDASAQLFHAAFENSPIGMAMFNTDGEFMRVNEALCTMLGRCPDELIGARDQTLTHPDDRQADVDAAWKILRGEMDRWQTEKRFIHSDGRIIWTIANLTFLRDDRGRPLSWLGQFQDITRGKEAEQRLQRMADHDDLTGIPNRRRVTRELTTRVLHAARYGERGALLVLDLDGFKAINDTSGHNAGDVMLVDIANALSQRVRRTDTLGRLGGDEFAVVLPHTNPTEATTVAETLVDAVSAASDGNVTASCGIATYGPGDRKTPEQLLAEADHAMYEAKRAGGSSVTVVA